MPQITHLLQQRPELCGLARSRWWLDGLRQAIPWLQHVALSTVWRTLRRWHLHYRRGRRYVHSPDWEYAAKERRIQTLSWYCRQTPAQLVHLYEDELTYYRRPTVSTAYVRSGQAVANQGHGSNTARRIAGCLDAHTGQLHAWQRAHFDVPTLLRFYQAVETAYPQAEQIFLIHDNWPVHWHPHLVQGLRGSKITLVGLPTYAPWLNPIEKVWRKLYQEVLHLHRYVFAWDDLQSCVQRWLDACNQPSLLLLRYVGLFPH